MLFALLKGFAASASLIIAIGAQNAFVIRQGLRRQHLFFTALFCSFIDALLISLGVLGIGELLTAYPLFIELSQYMAVLFLIFYGALSLKSSLSPKALNYLQKEESFTLQKTVLLLIGFSLFNPHVYLDTVILLGSIASQYGSYEQIYFAIGAISASFIWFFTITYGSRFLAPLLSRKHSWRVIDCLIAFIMWGIAMSLVVAIK